MSNSTKSTLSVKLEGNTIVVVRSGSNPHIERVALEDAPFLVEQLMKKGRHISARSVADAWFVGLAKQNGFSQYALADGSRNG